MTALKSHVLSFCLTLSLIAGWFVTLNFKSLEENDTMMLTSLEELWQGVVYFLGFLKRNLEFLRHLFTLATIRNERVDTCYT